MAKSIEQKAVDNLVNAISDNRFRYYEFCRIMSEEMPQVHKDFFRLLASYANFLSVYDQHEYYPNGTEEEAKISAQIAPIINGQLFP